MCSSALSKNSRPQMRGINLPRRTQTSTDHEAVLPIRAETEMPIPSDSINRDPEDRIVNTGDTEAKREKMLDKTIADSFPASDPPSSLPDPEEDSFCP
jgi:hypothetical protein